MAQRGQPDVPGRHDGVRNDLLLDAARVLMLFGAAAAIGSPSANPTQAFLGLLLWLLGVFLLEALVPAAGHGSCTPHYWPPSPWLSPIAVLMKHLFSLWN